MLHPDEVIPLNKEFNEYVKKMVGKGMKSISLNHYLQMDGTERIKYKRIKRVFEYDQNQSAIIYIWPSKEDREKATKRDNILKRTIKKLLMKDDINREERKLLTEYIEEEENK